MEQICPERIQILMARGRDGHGRHQRSVAKSDLRPWEAMEEGKKAVGTERLIPLIGEVLSVDLDSAFESFSTLGKYPMITCHWNPVASRSRLSNVFLSTWVRFCSAGPSSYNAETVPRASL